METNETEVPAPQNKDSGGKGRLRTNNKALKKKEVETTQRSTKGQTEKQNVVIHTMEYYSVIKRNEAESHYNMDSKTSH